ncbi:XK-related protein 7-like [Mytilus edulis]|uniref:XK-related protein 7-like n=2 Tax=Mytilus TaxID=6548 RepID=UPI0039EEB1F7
MIAIGKSCCCSAVHMTRDRLFVFKMAVDFDGGMHREKISSYHSPTKLYKNENSLNGLNDALNEETVKCAVQQNDMEIVIETGDELTTKLKGANINRLPKLYKPRDLLFSIFSTCLFVADFVSDILLALQYYNESNILLFQLTVTFIVAPSIFSFIINCVWNYMVYVEESEKKDLEIRIPKKLLFLRIFFSLIQLGRLFRNLEYMYYMVLSWKWKGTDLETRVRLRAMEEKRDACILGLVDGFLESAMQLLLQLYLAFHHNLPATFLRVVTLSLSLAGTSWIHTAFYRHSRNIDITKHKMGIRISFVYWLCVLAELSPRFLLLASFGAYFMPWCFILPSAHFLLMMTVHIYTNPELYGMCCCKAGKFLFLVLCSYINIFCFINVTGGKTFKKRLMFYILFYIENIVMVALSWYKTQMNQSYLVYTLLIAPVGFVCHMLFLLLYYKLFHPNNRTYL